ncbi:hypothetical protein GBA65_16460 [Rubrobacter marinus]|uniref:DNA primase/polymerase bifunctional N-terminal domain-containing protein n=1 Tax=Rubrobacter marinus TaxID=2653852 RepID=A0A6G8Q303_9ACTN|nr:bifunctional DNA primase/polymerase [Rubrobacter marinus]QIN80861.1 hypothetical protein GBA65_16460 [Rubrobacter marinus]
MGGVEGEGSIRNASPLARAALAYARRGLPVFPCEPLGKRPLTRDGFRDASADALVVGRWWSRWPRANIGVPTGERSALLVLDVDPRDGGLGSLGDLEGTFGPLPATTRAGTGGGGEHVFFRYPRAGHATAPPGWGRGWTCGGRAATSWSRRAAREGRTGGRSGRRSQRSPPGCSGA